MNWTILYTSIPSSNRHFLYLMSFSSNVVLRGGLHRLCVSCVIDWFCNYLLKDNGHLQNWGSLPCHGYIRNTVCVWSLPDLASILKDKTKYVINKFRSDFDPFIIECIRKGFIIFLSERV